MEQEKTKLEEIKELRAEMNRGFTVITERISEIERILSDNIELYDSLSRAYYGRIDKNDSFLKIEQK